MFKTLKNTLRRTLILFTAVVFLAGAVLPAAVSAAETEEDVLRAEAIHAVSDDFIRCTTGYLIYCNDPESTPDALEVLLGHANADGLTSAKDNGWVVVTPLALPEADEDAEDAGEDAQVRDDITAPCFMVDFRRPAGDINTAPDWCFETTVGGADVVAIRPGWNIAFRFTDADEPVYGEEAIGSYITALDRPQKLTAVLTQEEAPADGLTDAENKDKDGETPVFIPSESGKLTVACYAPENVRSFTKILASDPDRLTTPYGFSELTPMIRYDFSSGDSEPVSLTFPLTAEEAENVIIREFDFDDPNFRACFPAETFLALSEPVGEEDPDIAEPPVTFYMIDTENTTLTVSAAFVVLAVAADGSGETEMLSAKTDNFNCGAVNTLISDPTAIDAPVLSIESFDADAMKLYVSLDIPENAREAAVWARCMNGSLLYHTIDISVNGEEWHPADVTAGSLHLGTSDFEISLADEAMTDYAYIRLRAMLAVDIITGDEVTVIESPWSDSVAYDHRPEEIITAPPETETLPMYTEAEDPVTPPPACALCGICPAPYGVCLFLWIGAALLLVLLVVLIIAMIPKKRKCPRCNTKCSYHEKTCPSCGYRFVGSMPEISDIDADDADLPDNGNPSAKENVPDIPVSGEKDDGGTFVNVDELFRNRAEEQKKQNASAEFSLNTVPEQTAAPAAHTPETAAQTAAPVKAETPAAAQTAAVTLPAVTPEFLAALKQKMAAVKAGQKPTFTSEEAAYLRALRAKTAAEKAAKEAEAKAAEVKAAEAKAAEAKAAEAVVPEQPAEQPQTVSDADPVSMEKTREFRIPTAAAEHPAEPAVRSEKTVEKALSGVRFTPEQAAKLRALRAKQAAAEARLTEDAAKAETAETVKAGESAKAEEPVKAEESVKAEEPAKTEEAPETPAPAEASAKPEASEVKRVQKPPKMIKCELCAMPNPDTNERCCICGHILKK